MHTYFADGDFCGLLVLAIVSLAVGDRAARGRSRVRACAGCVAGLLFVLGLLSAFASGTTQGNDLVITALHAALVGGTVLGALWVILTVFAIVWEATIGSALRSLRAWSGHWRLRADERQRERVARARQRASEEAWKQAAPERQRAQCEAEAKARRAKDEQTRRDEARAAVELFYDAHAPEIAELFSREQLRDYLTRHLGDDREAARVEARAAQLQSLLAELVEKADPSPKGHTVDSLTQWYQQTRAQIDAQTIATHFKNAQLAQLHLRYVDLMNELMQEMEP